jgi:hypothetical protein
MSAADRYTAKMRESLDAYQRATVVYAARTDVYRADPKYGGNPDVADLAARDDRLRSTASADASWHQQNAVMWGIAALVEYCREGE